MKPYHLFVDRNTVDQSALSDFFDAMKLHFVVAGAAMPDMHKGYALPIGAVVATEGMIVPAWVGYDIGCGVCAIKTSAKRSWIEGFARPLFNAIYKAIPCGEGMSFAKGIPWPDRERYPRTALAEQVWQKRNGAKQFGTLGGGNHFIEIGYDENDDVWVLIHSGSRGFGHGLAKEYMRLACPYTSNAEGHFPLAVDSELGANYLCDMEFALEYALANRVAMLANINAVIADVTGERLKWETLINRNHNHATYRDGMWIHRKGATHAEEGMMGVIPGNMRDGSFIVRGKGNPDSLWSSSHGAGRVLGRNQANKTLNLEEFSDTMTGITAKVEQGTLDESPMAYKNIFEVMAQQEDLVEVVHRIKPLINVKG